MRPNLNPKVERTPATPMILQLDKSKLLWLLRHAGVSIPTSSPVDLDIKVSVRVPGGGDWSNTDLDIEGDVTIDVRWKQ